jgi:hypothetical protein
MVLINVFRSETEKKRMSYTPLIGIDGGSPVSADAWFLKAGVVREATKGHSALRLGQMAFCPVKRPGHDMAMNRA